VVADRGVEAPAIASHRDLAMWKSRYRKFNLKFDQTVNAAHIIQRFPLGNLEAFSVGPSSVCLFLSN
jgi:hypothetical protein